MKRGTQFLILSFFFALCVAQPDWDQSLDGDLQTVASNAYPLPFQPDITWAPSVENVTNIVNNTNNSFLRTYTSANITTLLNYENANKSADDSFRVALSQNITSFVQIKSFLTVAIFQVLNGRDSYDPEIQDFVIVARHQLRALAARYRGQELERFSWWFQTQADFAARRAVIRDARINLLLRYRNVSTIVEGIVGNNCNGLGILGGCNLNTVLNALTNGLLSNIANLTTAVTSLNTTIQNVTSLANAYNTDLQAIISNFNDTIGNYTEDSEDYAHVLDALKAFRRYELPTWQEVVERLQVLLVQDEEHVVFKRLVSRLWVGWQLGLDGETISFENTTAINETYQRFDLTFSVLLSRDDSVNSTKNETQQMAAVKLQSAIKSVLQTYALISRLYSDPVDVDNAGFANVRIYINFIDVESARQLASYAQNVSLPDPSTYENEYDEFVAALQDDASALVNSVNATLQNLTDSYRNYNEEIESNIVAFLQVRDEYYVNASAEIGNFTQQANLTAAQVAAFARLLVQRFILSANHSVEELRLSVARLNASIHEADARVQIIKLQAVQIAIAIANTTDAIAKAALETTLETLQEQIVEALQYREFKRQVYGNASQAVETAYNRSVEQQTILEDNAREITENATVALVSIKQRIRENYQNFVDTVVIAYRAYRQSLNSLTITANSDLNINDNVSLSFTVFLADSGALGEDADALVRTQINLLRAIFASITTDANIKVSPSAKRQTGSNVYTVSSGTPPTPTPTTPTTPTTPVNPTPTTPTTPTPVNPPTPNTPTTTPTVPTPVDTTPVYSGAVSVVMSFLAIVACLSISLF